MLNAHLVRKAPLSVRIVLELIAVTTVTLLSYLTIPMIRSVLRPNQNYIPLPFAEPFTLHLQIAIFVGSVSLLIWLFVSSRRGIIYGFLIPFLALLLWAVVKQNLLFNPDLWKLFERGWFTAALLAGSVGLFFAASAHRLISKALPNLRSQGD